MTTAQQVVMTCLYVRVSAWIAALAVALHQGKTLPREVTAVFELSELILWADWVFVSAVAHDMPAAVLGLMFIAWILSGRKRRRRMRRFLATLGAKGKAVISRMTRKMREAAGRAGSPLPQPA